MRKAINENRTVQIVLLGLLALVGAFILLKGRGGSASADSAASTPTSTAPATSGATSTTPGATAGDFTTSSPTVAAAGAAAVPASMVPGPSLPKSLLAAYHRGATIVLLVRRAGGIDDALVHGSVDRLRGLSGVNVFVTKARHIARYTWLTQGVDVTELPALIVLEPRRLSNGTPTATVSYGFRAPSSVVQAVKDALYKGPTRTYHP